MLSGNWSPQDFTPECVPQFPLQTDSNGFGDWNVICLVLNVLL
ncbi:MAG: hypothetical protein RLZZ436_4703 [Planctomycetota bacterium]|jgi:hypothetical protein